MFISKAQLTSLYFLLISYIATASAQDPQCYWPDGSPDNSLVPCDPTGSATVSCCYKNTFCTQNNLCLAGGNYYRGGCTDKSWKDGRCTGAKDCESAIPFTQTMIYVCGRDGVFGCDRSGNGAAFDCSRIFTLSGPWDIVLRADQVPSLSGNKLITVDPTGGLENLPAATITVTTTPPVRFSTVRLQTS